MDLRRQLAIIRARMPWLVGSVLVASIAAGLLSSVQPKVYEAEASLIVGQSLSGVNPDYNQLLVSQRLASTYAFVATTRPILERVIDRLNLSDTPAELAHRIRASTALESAVLTLTADDASPSRASALANAVANELISVSPAVQGQLAEVQKSIEDDLAATRGEIESTQAEVERLLALPKRTAAEQASLETLQGRLISLRSTFASLLSSSANSASNLLTLIQPAVAPDAPISPRPLLNILLAAVAALIIATGIAFVAEYLDDTLKDSDDVEEVAGLPTLGAIVRMQADGDRTEIYRLAALLYPRSPAAEAYRSLRTNVEFASVDAPISSLLVTSSAPSEGKTVTAANLAVVFAQAGRRVLLIDADLRRPGVHTIFGIENGDGLTTLLRNPWVHIDEVAHLTEQENLRIITCGPAPANPAELLASQRMRGLLERMHTAADLLIVDGPPLQLVTDAVIMSSYLDGTLFVIDAGRSRRATVRHGREALAKADANVLGAVLNRIPKYGHPGYQAYYGDKPEAAGTADGNQARPATPHPSP